MTTNNHDPRAVATMSILAHAERSCLTDLLGQMDAAGATEQGLLTTAQEQMQTMPALLEQILQLMQSGQATVAQETLETILGPVRQLDQNETLVNAATAALYQALRDGQTTITSETMASRILADERQLSQVLGVVEAIRDTAENLAERLRDRQMMMQRRGGH